MFTVHLSFALPWVRQGPLPAPGNRKAPQKQKRSGGEGGGEEIRDLGDKALHPQSSKQTPAITKIGSLCLPEGTVLAGPLFAGEEEISRFSRGAPAAAPAAWQGQGTASAELWARWALHSRGTALGSQGISQREDGTVGQAFLCRRGCRERPEPAGAGAAPGMGCGGEAEAGRVRPPPGKGALRDPAGVIWRFRGARCEEPGAAAPPAAAAPARPPSAGPPPPAAGSC